MDWRVKDARARVVRLGRTPEPKTGQIRANREKELFSHIWNKARTWGYTAWPNPSTGIASFNEEGRKDIYIYDTMFDR